MDSPSACELCFVVHPLKPSPRLRGSVGSVEIRMMSQRASPRRLICRLLRSGLQGDGLSHTVFHSPLCHSKSCWLPCSLERVLVRPRPQDHQAPARLQGHSSRPEEVADVYWQWREQCSTRRMSSCQNMSFKSSFFDLIVFGQNLSAKFRKISCVQLLKDQARSSRVHESGCSACRVFGSGTIKKFQQELMRARH